MFRSSSRSGFTRSTMTALAPRRPRSADPRDLGSFVPVPAGLDSYTSVLLGAGLPLSSIRSYRTPGAKNRKGTTDDLPITRRGRSSRKTSAEDDATTSSGMMPWETDESTPSVRKTKKLTSQRTSDDVTNTKVVRSMFEKLYTTGEKVSSVVDLIYDTTKSRLPELTKAQVAAQVRDLIRTKQPVADSSAEMEQQPAEEEGMPWTVVGKAGAPKKVGKKAVEQLPESATPWLDQETTSPVVKSKSTASPTTTKEVKSKSKRTMPDEIDDDAQYAKSATPWLNAAEAEVKAVKRRSSKDKVGNKNSLSTGERSSTQEDEKRSGAPGGGSKGQAVSSEEEEAKVGGSSKKNTIKANTEHVTDVPSDKIVTGFGTEVIQQMLELESVSSPRSERGGSVPTKGEQTSSSVEHEVMSKRARRDLVAKLHAALHVEGADGTMKPPTAAKILKTLKHKALGVVEATVVEDLNALGLLEGTRGGSPSRGALLTNQGEKKSTKQGEGTKNPHSVVVKKTPSPGRKSQETPLVGSSSGDSLLEKRVTIVEQNSERHQTIIKELLFDVKGLGIDLRTLTGHVSSLSASVAHILNPAQSHAAPSAGGVATLSHVAADLKNIVVKPTTRGELTPAEEKKLRSERQHITATGATEDHEESSEVLQHLARNHYEQWRQEWVELQQATRRHNPTHAIPQYWSEFLFAKYGWVRGNFGICAEEDSSADQVKTANQRAKDGKRCIALLKLTMSEPGWKNLQESTSLRSPKVLPFRKGNEVSSSKTAPVEEDREWGKFLLVEQALMYRAPLSVIQFLVEKAGYHSRVIQEPITYLYQAARHAEPDVEILDYLIKILKLNVNAKYGNGVTVLHELVSMQKTAASAGMKILVERYGADPHREDEQGVSPITLAREGGLSKLARSLELWAATRREPPTPVVAKPTTTVANVDRPTGGSVLRNIQQHPSRPSPPRTTWF